MPTTAEIIAAIEAAYSGDDTPRSGDVHTIRKGGKDAARAHVTSTDPRTGGVNTTTAVAFAVGGTTFYAMVYPLAAAGRTFVAAYTLDTEAEPPQVVPTAVNLGAAIESVFNSTNQPVEGDVVLLYNSTHMRFQARMTKTNLDAYTESDDSLFVMWVELDLGGETTERWWATLVQLGLY